MKPTVLHLTSEKTWRGGEVQVFLHLNNQSESISALLACPQNTPLASKAKGLGIITESINIANGVDISAAWKLLKICRRHRVNVIHCHAPKAHGVAFISRILGNRARFLATKRTIFPIKKNVFSQLKYRSADAIVCISPEVAEVVTSTIDVPVTTINSMLEPSSYRAIDWAKEKPSLSGKKIVGYVAAMTPEKDPDTFLEVAREVVSKRSDVHFVWIGKGTLQPSIQQQIRSMDLIDRVHLLGFQEEILDWISALDLFFFPSRSEGLGTSVLQAFHCRVPVVASDVGGLKSLVDHEVNGLLSDPGDVSAFAQDIIRLLEDVKLRDKLVKQSALKVQAFYPDQIVPRIEQLYRQLSGGSS